MASIGSAVSGTFLNDMTLGTRTAITSFDAGNIILGGAGSDIIIGGGGDDLIDGDIGAERVHQRPGQ